MEQLIKAINDPINGVVWGWPMVTLIAVTGIVLMLGLRLMPLQRIGYGVRMLAKPSEAGEAGDISAFGALMTSLSATIGTGNIAGVAGAIAIGGPGAVFWMWVIAVFGIATKYAEAVLAVRYREVDGLGNHVGGPMYYIRNGLGPNWQWLAVLFALFGMLAGFGIGNGVQCFEVSSALAAAGIPRVATGLVLGGLVFAVIVLSKFDEGAWIVVLLLPLMVWGLGGIGRRYQRVYDAIELQPGEDISVRWPDRQDVLENQSIVWLASWSRPTLEALRYAAQVSDRVIGVWVCEPNDDFEALRQRWHRLVGDAPQFELRLLESPFASLIDPFAQFVAEEEARCPESQFTIVMPMAIPRRRFDHLLLNQRGLNMREALNERRSRVFTLVRYFPPA